VNQKSPARLIEGGRTLDAKKGGEREVQQTMWEFFLIGLENQKYSTVRSIRTEEGKK